MKVSLEQIALNSVEKSVVAIGSFDGVHAAHRKLLERVVATSKELAAASVVVTFAPHPRIFFEGSGSSLRFLNTLQEKIELLSGLGVDYLFCLPFNYYCTMKGVDFVKNVLIEGLGCKHLFAGYNHNFGSDRISLTQLDRLDVGDFALSSIEKFELNGFKVSSTVVRQAVASGEMLHACRLLQAPYPFWGVVDCSGAVVSCDNFKLVPAKGSYTAQLEGRVVTVVSDGVSLRIEPPKDGVNLPFDGFEGDSSKGIELKEGDSCKLFILSELGV